MPFASLVRTHRYRTYTQTACLLLALLWFSGCRQIPTAPERVPPTLASSANADGVKERIQHSAPVTQPAIVEAAPAMPRQTPPPFRPQGGDQASWLPQSHRPKWLQDCLAFHQLDRTPTIERKPLPKYPPELIEQDVQGRGTLLLHIAADGTLAHYLVRPGAHPELVKSTVAAVKQWKFSRSTRNGQPVDACFLQPFRYQLEE